MQNNELKNDTVETILIVANDDGGDTVALPADDTFTVVSSNPASLGAALSADGKSIVLTPLVAESPGLTVTVSDSKGLKPFVLTVDIVKDLTPTALGLDVANASTVPQPVPTNPGP